ncbi:esterase [Brucella endophytica]|uniref:Esterase n=1 Tax=Brucella endophytica TaxID=1963359 RepID=A0A916WG90_9HYPH|nr:alpha/beta hydrolase-fold protein [Brucella endophytica]GGA94896.1 esterase [Brucella endophytica]
MRPFNIIIAVAISLFAGEAEAKRVKWNECDPGGVQTLSVPDPISGRSYNVEISLPASYAPNASARYPIIYLADGDRGTRPVACQIKALYEKGDLAEEPILVGLSYAKGESLEVSRKRDYTPVPRKPGDTAYGGAEAYQRYLRLTVIPFVESRYHADPGRRIYLGHSYGGLLGAHILLTEPDLFHTYILGSPSIWFANHAILRFEANYAQANKDLKANVLLFVGGEEVSRHDAARGGNTQDMVGDMRAFESQLKQRGYRSLTVKSLVVPGKNHRKVFPPGLTWAITDVLGPAIPR